ncbi:small ribosomal subunit Rsm22 family protein [Luteipulveratus halotolerans]|uniref:rRNA methyltransferase n=1 Tax=Luteipulveratus halotolerans TaxID=1631356 RepID=A0A0L6CEE5_9MICO|nr:small ribosomal subunit Rsm22 family protein [Luteipulveratus halotolerans]KNX36049.1 hypothetical protein VV01_01000 [Luteipulveratus halotolerans]
MSEISTELRAALERASSGASTVAVTAAVERLSARYRTVAAADSPILSSRADVLAYAVYRMPATYAAVRLALLHGLDAGLGAVESLVDLGGGTGASVWAAADVLPGLAQATVLEQVAEAHRLGRDLAGDTLPRADWRTWRLGEPVPAGDLVTVSYVLSELSPSQQQRVVDDATGAAQRAVLVVEPGTPDGHRRVLTARAALIDADWQVIAPCPHALGCPLAVDDWCHFAARVNRSALHRKVKGGELSHEDEKFSYVLAVRPGEAPSPGGAARVVRHPVKRKGLVELQLCRPDGSAGREVVSKRQGPAYKAARDVAWGDAWPPDPS